MILCYSISVKSTHFVRCRFSSCGDACIGTYVRTQEYSSMCAVVTISILTYTMYYYKILHALMSILGSVPICTHHEHAPSEQLAFSNFLIGHSEVSISHRDLQVFHRDLQLSGWGQKSKVSVSPQ